MEMHLLVLSLCCFWVWVGIFQGCLSINISPKLSDDVLGLIVLKSEVQDPNHSLQSWNEEDQNPCSWSYVKCDPVDGRVSELALDRLSLSGKIGKGLEKLQSLQVLSLSHNKFYGNISTEFFHLSKLRSLDLSHNSFSGSIPPGFVKISSFIEILDISENLLSGFIHEDLFDKCGSLRFISFGGNYFRGSLPSTISNCKSLEVLNISQNNLSGRLDFSNTMWSLMNLRILDFSNNAFMGPVPNGIKALQHLEEMHLQKNGFTGLVPIDIGECSHLSYLNMSNNLFTGPVPDSLSKASDLKHVDLSKNRLLSEFPLWIKDLSNLEHLDLSYNQLWGSLPSSLGDLKNLKFFSASSNQLTGEIPISIGNCTNLTILRLTRNNFDGSIPPELFALGLEQLDLSSNGLIGPIPSGSTRFFESIHFLDLSHNELSGDIPPEIGLYANVRYLNLSWNHLHSRLPPEIGYFKELFALDLRNNDIYGPIPGELCESHSLSILQLDNNSFSGQIPEDIGNCSSLYLLSLSHNGLSGYLPESISKLKKLKIFNLSVNNFTGEIPQSFGGLNDLLAVNLSYNRLVGRIPTGSIFGSLDQSALRGNIGLCAPVLTEEPCTMNVPKPLVLNPDAYEKGGSNGASESDSKAKTLNHRRFLGISAIISICASCVIFCGVVMVMLLNVSARRRMEMMENDMEKMTSVSRRSGGKSSGKMVLLENDGTSGWDDWLSDNAASILNKAYEIGKGVFGTVYKASIDGRMMAIKKLTIENLIQTQEEFEKEMQVIRKASHPNLMTMKGFYYSPNMQLIASDFASNGSLHNKLHHRHPNELPLSWANRFKIAMGAAEALTYLHQSFDQPIIHYDFKPDNILLDEYFHPKVSDFGLAKLLCKLDRYVIYTKFQCSLGYIAPELASQSLGVSEKCDVYGFGMVILELVTGRKAVEFHNNSVVLLTEFVKMMIEQGKILDCVDSNMDYYPEEEVLPVLKLGLVCTSQIPSSRPSMAEVVQILQVIKTPVPGRLST